MLYLFRALSSNDHKVLCTIMKKSTIAPITALDLQQHRSVLLAVSHFSLDSFLLLFFSYPMPQAAPHTPLHHTTTRRSASYHKTKPDFFSYPMTGLDLQQQRSVMTSKRTMLWRPQQQSRMRSKEKKSENKLSEGKKVTS